MGACDATGCPKKILVQKIEWSANSLILRALDQPRQKARQIVGVMFDEIGGFGFGGDQHGAQSHRMGHGKIAWIILEHRGAGLCQPVDGKNRLKGGALGFGDQACVFNAVDGIKYLAQSTMSDMTRSA